MVLRTNKLHARKIYLAIAATMLSMAAPATHAADQTWTGSGGSGAWRTTGNWSGAAFPGSSTSTTNTDIVTIAVATQPTMGINFNNTTNGVFSFGGISFNSGTDRVLGDSSGTVAGVLTLNGATINSVNNVIIRNAGSGNFTFQALQASAMGVSLGNSTNNIVVIDSSGNVTISSNITGSSRKLSVQGGASATGDLILTGTNSFTGGMDASGTGKVRFGATAAFPTSGNFSVSGDGRLRFAVAGTFGSSSQTITLNPTGTTNPAIDEQANNLAVVLNPNVTLSADSRIEANGATGTLTLAGNLTGSGALIKQAGGTLVLSGTGNTASGATQIGNGAITVNSGSLLGTGALTLAQTSTNATTLNLNNTAQSVGSLSSTWTAVTGTIDQRINLTGTALTVNQAVDGAFGTGAVGTLTSTIAGTGSLIKSGSANLTLSSANTYGGNTTISNGKLIIGTTGSIAGATVAVNSGTLNVNGTVGAGTGSLSIGSSGILSGSGTVNKAISFSSTGGKISPGNSPGILNTVGETWTNGNTYVWEVNNWTATPTAGTHYDRIAITGTLNISALTSGTFPTNTFKIDINGLTAGNAIGAVPGFDNTATRQWTIATFTGGIVGTFNPNLFTLDTTNFAANNSLGSGAFSLTADANNLYLNFASAGAPTFVFADTTATTLNVLKGAALASDNKTKSIQNNGSAAGTPTIGSVTNLSTSAVGSINAGNSSNVTLSPTSTAAYSTNSGTLSVTPNGGANEIAVTVNVGNATAGNSGTNDLNAFVLGNKLTADVGAGASYVGLASKVNALDGGGLDFVGTEAIIVQGKNTTGAAEIIGMNWRNRATIERPGSSTLAPVPGAPLNGLISDVVDLTGLVEGPSLTQIGDRIKSDIYALQMSYDDGLLGNELVTATGGNLRLVWLDTDHNGATGPQTDDLWKFATEGNFGVGGSAVEGFAGSWTTFAGLNFIDNSNLGDFLGSWGYDTVGNTVWAVLDHDAQFAVVPEPASLGLLSIGALALLRRKRSS